ncbi:MAG: helix-turn-helix transcriptional regulator [Actinophytocola sp.]|uniref:hypothetical protein n=1 Tax=Actinophytocola sp. TaxID=1872138 RepID=UPI003C7235F9
MTTDPGTDAGTEAVFSPHRFRAWRDATGTPSAALADAGGATVADVEACTRGEATPNRATLARWARLLGCTVRQLTSATPLDPREYWQAASEAMGPMSPDDLAVIADVLVHARARRDAHTTATRETTTQTAAHKTARKARTPWAPQAGTTGIVPT